MQKSVAGDELPQRAFAGPGDGICRARVHLIVSEKAGTIEQRPNHALKLSANRGR